MNEIKICPDCKTENLAIANFCRKCRHDFRSDGTESVIIQEPDNTLESGVTLKPPIVKSRIFLVSLLSILLIGALGMAIYIHSAIHENKNDALPEVIVNYIPETFSGNYTVLIQSEDEKQRYTATVSQFASSSYRIDMISEYGKMNYTFAVNPDGTLNSPELGKGVVSYKSIIGKLTIEFSMEDVKCVLSRVQ